MDKMIQCISLALLLLASSFLAAATPIKEDHELLIESSDHYEKAYRYNIQGWIYLHIEGEPYERGFQHGYLLSAEIVDMLNRWSNIIHNYPKLSRISQRLSEERYNKISELWWNFCVKNCYELYWDKYPEEYQQEISGIAAGITAGGGTIHGRDIHPADILTMNEMYEFMSKLEMIPKKIHPLRTFFHHLQQIIPETSDLDISNLINSFLSQAPAHHCNG